MITLLSEVYGSTLANEWIFNLHKKETNVYIKNSVAIFLVLAVFFTSLTAYAEETVGEEDLSTESRLLFLQDTTVLLNKGDQRFGTSFSMASDEQRVLFSLISRRIFSSTLSYSLGVGYGTELFVSASGSSEKTKVYDFISDTGEEESRSEFGNGVFGIKKTLFVQGADAPELVGSLSFSSPLSSGSESYPKDTAVTIGMTVIKSVDPVVLYGGISFTRPFGDESNAYGVRIGTAFAVNHKIAFGGEFSITEFSDEHATLSPTSVFTLRETYNVSRKFSVEPAVSIGLSGGSPDSVFSISFSWRL